MKTIIFLSTLVIATLAIYNSCDKHKSALEQYEFETSVDCSQLDRGDLNFNHELDDQDYEIIADDNFNVNTYPCAELADVNNDGVFDQKDIDSLWLLLAGIK